MKHLALLFAAGFYLLLFFSRCGSRPYNEHELPADFTIIPIDQYKFEPSAIKTGSPVSIVAYSGGKDDKDGKLYYSQFIVVDHATGDTTRILCAAIGIDSAAGSPGEYFSPVDQFDGQKGVFDAIYEQPSAQDSLIITNLAYFSADKPDMDKITAAMKGSSAVKAYVLVNKAAKIFLGNYKTAKGILRFHVQPWTE